MSSSGGREDRPDPAPFGSAATAADALVGASSIVSRRRFSSAATAAIAALAAGGESVAEDSDSQQSPRPPAVIQRPRHGTYPDPVTTVAASLDEAAAAAAVSMPGLPQQPRQQRGSFISSDSAAGGCNSPQLASRCSELQEVPPKSAKRLSAVGSEIPSRPSSGEQSLPSLQLSEMSMLYHISSVHGTTWMG